MQSLVWIVAVPAGNFSWSVLLVLDTTLGFQCRIQGFLKSVVFVHLNTESAKRVQAKAFKVSVCLSAVCLFIRDTATYFPDWGESELVFFEIIEESLVECSVFFESPLQSRFNRLYSSRKHANLDRKKKTRYTIITIIHYNHIIRFCTLKLVHFEGEASSWISFVLYCRHHAQEQTN